MGYDIHITRAGDWFDSETSPISLEDWVAYVTSDPEMRLDNAAETEAEADGQVIRLESEGLAVWTAFSGHGAGGNMAWFYFSDGQVQVKNPNREVLGKMLQIAKQLAAKVQGDDGEEYSRVEDLSIESDSPSTTRRPWWRLW